MSDASGRAVALPCWYPWRMTTTATSPRTVVDTPSRSPLYSALIGLSAVAVLLQAVWAGVFIREGKEDNDTWVSVHARGADVAIALALAATIAAFLKLRDRRDLLIGTAVFSALLIVEAYLGGLVGNNQAVEIAHFPIAMGLMGLAVWLPLRVRRRA